MWGYIVGKKKNLKNSVVPSLYVRVYHHDGQRNLVDCSSLIICEGISPGEYKINQAISFPHYMWGYIVLQKSVFVSYAVPSLYVRVYHWSRPWLWYRGCSLIICEGISNGGYATSTSYVFPHYMWGYIPESPAGVKKDPVTSLYVRVYQGFLTLAEQRQRSLIICEGISPKIWIMCLFRMFPHYMWGYIAVVLC